MYCDTTVCRRCLYINGMQLLFPCYEIGAVEHIKYGTHPLPSAALMTVNTFKNDACKCRLLFHVVCMHSDTLILFPSNITKNIFHKFLTLLIILIKP